MNDFRMIPAIVAATALTGCGDFDTKARPDGWGAARHQFFVECMELAAKLSPTHEADGDGVAEVVDECDSYAYFMANSYVNSNALPAPKDKRE